MNKIDQLYTSLVVRWKRFVEYANPHLRMFVRFLALPYAYIFLVNWNECKASRLQVIKDFLYVFFVLRDFPDYYSVFCFWEKDRSEWKFYYGSTYNPYQRGRLRREIQKKEYEILFEDKHICNQLCTVGDIPVPEFKGYLEPSDNYVNVVRDLFSNDSHGKFIIKDNRGKGGRGVYLASKKNGEVIIEGNKTTVSLDNFVLDNPSIVQGFIIQHPMLSEISPSVNTVRTETILTKDKRVVIIGAFIRFGIEGNFLDNQCAGGLSIGIDIDSGRLYPSAMNGKGEKFYHHPETEVKFDGIEVPHWREIIELSEKIQHHFSFFKLLGPDIAITENGPVVIEINATPDHAGLEMDYGPVFKRKEVWAAFREHDLLINNASKNIW